MEVDVATHPPVDIQLVALTMGVPSHSVYHSTERGTNYEGHNSAKARPRQLI